MFFIYNIFFFILFVIFCKLFFIKKREFSYTLVFRFYFLFILIFIFIFYQLDYFKEEIQFKLICITFNFLLFISYILTIGVKFVDSPSYFIIDYLQKNKEADYDDVLKILNDNSVLEKRIINLKKEKMIYEKDYNVYLTQKGLVFCKFFSRVKNYLNLKSEG